MAVKNKNSLGMANYWRTALTEYESVPFPRLPPSIDTPVPEEVIEHPLPCVRDSVVDTTVSTLFRAAWALVAGTASNSEDVVFGAAVSSRDANGDVNTAPSATVPVRVKLARDDKVSELLKKVQQQATEMIPFEQTRLDQISKVSSEARQACAFQTLLVHSNENHDAENAIQQQPNYNHALVIEAQLGLNKPNIRASFDPRVIKSWQVNTLLKGLEHVMQQLHRAVPQQTLAEIEMIVPQDLERIWEWNKTVPAAVDRCVHDIVEEIALAQPSAPAVSAWDGNLTYRELNKLATRLAGQLVNLGVGPEVLVPLCFEKSVWTTVAILGVLKAGGSFLHLDYNLPEQRLQSITQQTKAKVILCSDSNVALSSRLAPKVITINSSFFTNLQSQPSKELRPVDPSATMYNVFTSGSTGTPKGVIISHRNLASALHHQKQSLGFTSESRVFDFSAYSFDMSVYNVFTTLTAGACLCVPSDQDRRDRLVESIASSRATALITTASVARTLSPEDLPELQSMTFVGEEIRVNDVKTWWGKVRVINGYAPAECTPLCHLNGTAPNAEEAVRLGRGRGVSTWIVDPNNHNRLLPPGCVGEILLEGPLVGQGYLNDAEKTAAAFIQNPTWLLRGAPNRPGRSGRLYKTGDLGQYDHEGSLIFVGRKDTQVKIRGQRVELGEVEHWVLQCMPEASYAVAEVVVPKAKSATPVLAVFLQIDYLEASDSTPATILPIPAHIEVKLKEYLPSYMVPSVFFAVTALPMTSNGKLNRGKLREIGASFSARLLAEARTRGPKRQPTSSAEQHIQAIWARILDMEPGKIGLDDSFFRLGGDSIAAMRVVREAREVGIELSVANIFRQPTLHKVASQAVQVENSSTEPILPFTLLGDGVDTTSLILDLSAEYGLEATRIQDAYPCTPLQEGLVALTSKQSGDYILQSTLELPADIDIDKFRNAWQQIVKAIPILRTRIVQQSLGLVQLVLDEEIHWTEASSLKEYIEDDRKLPMDLGHSLTRYGLVQEADTRSFVWTAHHALYDGWSLPLIMKMVARAYRGEVIKEPPPFNAFVKYIEEQDEKTMTDYWRQSLGDCNSAPFPALPPSVQQPVADTFTERLVSLPQQSRAITASTLIRAAWALVTGSMTNSDDIVFGVTVSGRNAPVPGIDEMPAPTIATVPVRIRLERDQTISDYLETVQQQAADMIPFEQTGLQQIAKISPDSKQACMFQTLLVVHPQEDDAVDVIGKPQDGNQAESVNTYGLVLQLQLSGDKIMATASFDSRAIESWMVERLINALEHVMQQLDHSSPDQALADVQLVPSQDLEQIWDWNSAVPEPVERCVHDLVSERVQKQPNAPAVCAWDGELTYAELDHLSTRLASQLVSAGIQPEVLVPLCFEKSMWAPVAMYAVLKAGGGFVLLDSSLPEQRLQSIVQQTNTNVILSSTANLELSSRLSKTVIQVDADSIYKYRPGKTQTRHMQSSSTAMYAVFTSGSTGTSKGAVMTHTNFSSGVTYQAQVLRLSKDSRVFDFASYAFDAAVQNAFATFVTGGCLCIPADTDRRDNVGKAMQTMRVTVADLTPSVARLIDPDAVPDMETIILGGEAVSVDDATRWWGKVHVINAYGPAECTIMSTLNANPATPQDAVRIGKGAGLVTWVVDPENHDLLLAPGSTGELLLEGPLVGRGYLN